MEQAMEHLSTWKESEGGTVLRMGKNAIQQGEAISAEMELRDRLIDLVSVGNLRHKPEALFALFRQFLKRISLPRLIHFLPQLMPVQAAWAGEEKTLWSCHYIRYLCDKQYANNTPRVQISYFFTSHDHVHHVRIQWNNHPLLLFSDPQMVEALPVEHFRKQASHVTHQQHLQMGLRKGMAILIDLFEKDSFLFVKCVLPFAFASCVRDFKSNLDFGKTTFRYMNKLPNLN